MRIKYVGTSHYRTISTADFEKKGIYGFETTTWVRWGTEDILDEAGQWLLDNASVEFAPGDPETLIGPTSEPDSSTDSIESTDSLL